MRRYLLIAAGLLALLSPVRAADSTVSAMSAASALGGTELLYCVQGGADRKCTPAQLATYVGTIPLTVVQRTETGANPALPSSDQAKVVYLSNGSNQIPTIAQAGTGSFTTGWFATYCNIGAGTQTITPTTSTIGGAPTLLLPAGSAARPQCANILSDGTNYTLVPQSGTVFSGTLALATSAIGSAACSSAQTVTAPGVATTDVPLLSFNADPTAVTGYVPLTAGMLTIIAYPTANTVNVKVCNNTSSSITPGAITLNVKVMR